MSVTFLLKNSGFLIYLEKEPNSQQPSLAVHDLASVHLPVASLISPLQPCLFCSSHTRLLPFLRHFRHVSIQGPCMGQSLCLPNAFPQVSTGHGPLPPLSFLLHRHIKDTFHDDLKLQPFYPCICILLPCFISLPSTFHLRYRIYVFLSLYQNINYMKIGFGGCLLMVLFSVLRKVADP